MKKDSCFISLQPVLRLLFSRRILSVLAEKKEKCAGIVKCYECCCVSQSAGGRHYEA